MGYRRDIYRLVKVDWSWEQGARTYAALAGGGRGGGGG